MQQRQAALPAQEDFQTAAHEIGGRKNQQRREPVGAFALANFIHQCVFEIGMKWTENGSHEKFSPPLKMG